MRVEIINKEELLNMVKNHGEFACVCYGTPDKYAEKVGKSCQESGHMSGSRCEYIKFRIYDIDRGTAEQIMRHEVGTNVPFDEQDNYSFIDINPSDMVKNMASFRYIDKDGFKYTIPRTIRNCPAAVKLYNNLMRHIDSERREIKEILESSGVNPKKATEDANFVLPRATETALTIGFTPEALINFMYKRLCVRAQDEVRAVAIEMKKQIRGILPEFSKKLQPHCKYLMWCPEGKNDCMAPTKDELRKIIGRAD